MENKTKCYTMREKVLLAQLVKDNQFVENKKTDAVSVQEKNDAWRNICEIYNSQPEVETKRQPQQLRKLWNNLKQRKRKETTEYRHSMLLTGGGPSVKVISDPVMDLVDDAAPNLDITIDNPYDSTSAFEVSQGIKVGQPITVQVDKLIPFQEGLKPSEFVTNINKNSDNSGNSRIVMYEECDIELPNAKSQLENKTNSDNNFNHGNCSTPPRRYTRDNIKNNKDAFLIKNMEATQQQQELHEIRMKIAEEELKRAKLETQRAKAEAELAMLKLEYFKNNHLE